MCNSHDVYLHINNYYGVLRTELMFNVLCPVKSFYVLKLLISEDAAFYQEIFHVAKSMAAFFFL